MSVMGLVSLGCSTEPPVVREESLQEGANAPASGAPDDPASTSDRAAGRDATTMGAPLPLEPPSSQPSPPAAQPRSAGCGRTTLGAGFHAKQTLDVRGAERTYDVYVPKGYDVDREMAVVVVLHADTAISLRSYFPIEAAANEQAIVVYPYGFGAWDLSAPDSNYDYPFIEGLRAALEESFCVDKQRVFGFGYSNGGFLANMLACYRGADLFRAIAVNSGGLYAPEGVAPQYDDQGTFMCPAKPVAALIIHGKNDGQVSYSTDGIGARDTWLAANHCASETTSVTPSPCVVYDKCQANAVGFCSLNAGHALWANAATAAWSFFSSL